MRLRDVHALTSIVAGLDLAASPRRPTGYALAVEGVVVDYGIVYSDEEVVEKVASAKVVAIDAPLTLPSSPGTAWRHVDKLLLKAGYRLLPLTLPGMRMLTERAIKLKRILERLGARVVETHPTSAWLSSSCPSPIDTVCRILVCVDPPLTLSKDVVDALIATSVAYCTLKGCSVSYEAEDGVIHLLKPLCP